MAVFSQEEMAELVKEYVEKWTAGEALRREMQSSWTDVERIMPEMYNSMKNVIAKGGTREFEEFTDAVLLKLTKAIEEIEADASGTMAKKDTQMNLKRPLPNEGDGTSTPVQKDKDLNSEMEYLNMDNKANMFENVQTDVKDVTQNTLSTERKGSIDSILHRCLVNLALFRAAQLGKVDVVKFLVETKGADVNKAGWEKITPLWEAALQGLPAVVKVLLEGGADVSQTGEHGRTVLVAAVVCGFAYHSFETATRHQDYVNCVDLLLKAGADVNQSKNGWHRTALSYALKLWDLHMLKLLLDAGPSGNELRHVMSCLWDDNRFRAEAAMKLIFAAGAKVNTGARLVSRRQVGIGGDDDQTPQLTRLVFAAGQDIVVGRDTVQQFLQPRGGPSVPDKPFHLPGWHDLDLKNQCKKVIRQHLLTLDPHTNLFIRVSQLQMTNEKAGLPEKLVSYLLYDQNLEVDWDKNPFRIDYFYDSDSDGSIDSDVFEFECGWYYDPDMY